MFLEQSSKAGVTSSSSLVACKSTYDAYCSNVGAQIDSLKRYKMQRDLDSHELKEKLNEYKQNIDTLNESLVKLKDENQRLKASRDQNDLNRANLANKIETQFALIKLRIA